MGVGISIAAFVSLVGLTEGLERTLKDTFSERGTDLVVIEKGTVDILSSTLDQSLLDRIRQMPGVLDASPIIADLYALKLKQYIMIYGWETGSYLFRELKMAGRLPISGNEVIVGELGAKRIKKGLGDELKIRNQKFTIVGLFESRSLLEEGAIIMPLERLQELKKMKNKVTLLNIKIRTPDVSRKSQGAINKEIERVQEAITAAFADIEVKNIQSFISTNTHIFIVLQFTWAISIVAFIIVILGIINTMVASVFERTREIGILLAIGWRKTKIMALILYESSLLGLLGGVIGTAVGFAMIKMLVSRPELQNIMSISYDPIFILKSMIISTGLGLLSGVYPACKAISIDPVEVLRYE